MSAPIEAERTWRVGRGLITTDSAGVLTIKHEDIPDDTRLGVMVPVESWVPQLLEFLKNKRTDLEIAQRFPSSALPGVLARLRHNGVIFSHDDDEDVFLIRATALSIARNAMRMAAAARAAGKDLGDAVDADGVGAMLTELGRVSGELTKLTTLVATAQKSLVRRQVEGLAQADGTALKLHLGCGNNAMDAWVNIDLETGDVRADLRNGLPFPDASASHVYCAHVLEHLSYPAEALPLVREIRRVLRPGGTVRIVVPDIAQCIRAYASGDSRFFEERAGHWAWAQRCRTPLEQFLEYTGANRSPFDLIGHKYGYDFETLEQLLREGGFATVVGSTYQRSEQPELRVDDRSHGAGLTAAGVHLSLFVEAIKE